MLATELMDIHTLKNSGRSQMDILIRFFAYNRLQEDKCATMKDLAVVEAVLSTKYNRRHATSKISISLSGMDME